MRKPRAKLDGQYFTHCISRVVDRKYILGTAEKDKFVQIMRKLEGFTGISIINYCVMSNHFHLLLESPDRSEQPRLTKETLLEKMQHLYDEKEVARVAREISDAEKLNHPLRIQQILDRYEKRMWDVSNFMKELKQRFSQWYNRCNNRVGTLWEQRFKDVLVEGSPNALTKMSAYIDLNPVRAGMVNRVEEYRWCGYGAAIGGCKKARAGLATVLSASSINYGAAHEYDWKQIAGEYRLNFYRQGEEGYKGRKGFTPEQIENEEIRSGELSIEEIIRYRVRYFTDGMVFGSAAFIEEFFQNNRTQFGKKRKQGSRHMRGAKWGDLCVALDLRKQIFS